MTNNQEQASIVSVLTSTIQMMEDATKQHGNGEDLEESALVASIHQSVVSSTECESLTLLKSEEDVSTNTTTHVTNGSNNDDSSRVLPATSSVYEKIGDIHCDRSAWQLATNEAFVQALNLRATSSAAQWTELHALFKDSRDDVKYLLEPS